ncbi:AMP-dependent synthetase and ligase [Mycobacteroides abscessus subsp. abscessus]|nr:AMP-dependent synthetase and ligase [Mycobacteroides abscessus subsp. abscessus]
MVVASGANAVLGIVFWVVAAKLFQPAELGVMTAVLAVITSVGVVVATGIGDSYTALLPAVGTDRPSVYRRGQRLFAVLVLIGATAAAIGTVSWLDEVRGSTSVAILVAVGVAVWAVANLQNSTLIALGRASWLPGVNIAISAGKLVLLPLFAFTLAWHPLEVAFVLAACVVTTVVAPRIVRIVDSGEDLPSSTIPGGLAVRDVYRFVGQTTASSALTMGLFLVSPFLVAVWSNPGQGALFSLSLAIVQTLDLIGAALSTSMVVHASSCPEDAGLMARATLVKAVFVSVIGAAVLIAVGPTVLRLLNAQYGSMGATAVVATLAVGTICRLVYQVWAGLQRARRRMRAPLLFNIVSAGVLLVSMPLLCNWRGALGGAQALLLAQLALSLGMGLHYLAGKVQNRGEKLRVDGR